MPRLAKIITASTGVFLQVLQSLLDYLHLSISVISSPWVCYFFSLPSQTQSSWNWRVGCSCFVATQTKKNPAEHKGNLQPAIYMKYFVYLFLTKYISFFQTNVIMQPWYTHTSLTTKLKWKQMENKISVYNL